jgi:diaminohydroxyphosphoribosylaminopyrimidine deaminase/5-amino-6-(5-phosphoribosylamino)uracil reductase
MSASSEFIARAIALSRQGFPAPNPHVGCVIVREGVVVGEGYHDHAGGPHAERVALDRAGERARGAELYCTLEPCNHQGRTGPCSQAVVAAGIAKAVIALRDPNPRAEGGIEFMRSSGVECEVGLMANEARDANEVFMTAMERKRPYVVLKSATTSDGFIARADGTSKWITGEEARAVGHRLRAEMGCVLVGRVTVERDDPQLTARVPGVVNQPLRAILDPRAVLGPHYRVFSDGGETVRFVKQGLAQREGDVEVEVGASGFDLGQVLTKLFERGVIGVLVEGGGETAATFLRKGLVDRLERFTSPKVFGSGSPWLGASSPELRLEKLGEQRLGEDLHESFRVLGTGTP